MTTCGFLLVFFFFTLLFLSFSHLYLFLFSLTITISPFLLLLFHFLCQSVSCCPSLALLCLILLQGVIYVPALVDTSIIIHKAAVERFMCCSVSQYVWHVIMCGVYCAILCVFCILVADESNVGSLVGQRDRECLI